MMNLTCGPGLDDEAGTGAQALLDQMLVDRRRCQQRRNGDMLGIDLAIGDDQDVGTGAHGIFGISSQRSETRLDTILAPSHRITNIQFQRAELVRGVLLDIAQLFHVVERQNRLRHFEADRRIDVVGV